MSAPINLAGERFGRLTVIRRVESRRTPCGSMKRYWECLCDCGTVCVAPSASLRNGQSQSCGCLQRERASVANITHGHTVDHQLSGTYSTYRAMLTRCTNPRQRSWKNYGGRGVRVCDRWMRSFEAFAADMGPRPARATIERIDNAGDYEPGNCRWATRAEQNRNSRANRLLTIAGMTATVAEWADRSGVHSSTIRQRLARGWDPTRAVSAPVSQREVS